MSVPPKRCLRNVVWCGFLILWCGLASADAPDIRTELEVEQALPDGATATRTSQGLVTLGLPFSEQECVQKNSLGEPQLTIEGVTKAQFQTLMQYPSGCVQWAGVDFITDLEPNAKLRFFVNRGSGSYGGTYLATVSGDHIDINTGPLQATLCKSGSNLGKLFGQVMVDGQTFVEAANESRVEAKDLNGVLYSSRSDPATTVVLEENGPVKAVVLMRGSLKSSSGVRLLDYTLRLKFTSGSKQIDLDFFRRNATTVRTKVDYEDINLRIPLSASALKTPLNVTYPLPWDPWYISLSLPNDKSQAVFYQSYIDDIPHIGIDLDTPWDPNKNDGQGGPAETGFRVLTVDPNGGVTTHVDEPIRFPQHVFMQVVDQQRRSIVTAMRWSPWRSFNTQRVVSNPPELILSPRDEMKIASYREYWPVHDERNQWLMRFETGQMADPYLLAQNLSYRLVARAVDSHRYDSFFAPGFGIPTEAEQIEFQKYLGLDDWVHRFGNCDFFDINHYYAGTAGYTNNSPAAFESLIRQLRFGDHGGCLLTAEDRLYYDIGRRVPVSDGFDYKDRPGDPIQPDGHERWSDETEHEYSAPTVLTAFFLADREKIERFQGDVIEWWVTKNEPKEFGYLRAYSQHLWNASLLYKVFRNDGLKSHLLDRVAKWKDYMARGNGEGRGWIPPNDPIYDIQRPFWSYFGAGGRGECAEYNPTARGFFITAHAGRAVNELRDVLGTEPQVQELNSRFVDLAGYVKDELMSPLADGMCHNCCMRTTTQQYEWDDSISFPTHGWSLTAYDLTGDPAFIDFGNKHYTAFATMGDTKQPGTRIELLQWASFMSSMLGSRSDASPPVVTKVEAPDNTTVRITFDRILDPSSAEKLKNYQVVYLANSHKIALQSAQARYNTVELTTTEPEQPFEFIKIGIQDVKSWKGVKMAPYVSPPMIHAHFDDQFTADKDGQPLDPKKWDVFGPGSYRVTVRKSAMNVEAGKSGDWFTALTKSTPFHNETCMLGAIVKPWANTGAIGVWVDADGAGSGYFMTFSSQDQKLSIFTFPGGTLVYQADIPGLKPADWNTLIVRTGRPQASQRRLTVYLNGVPAGDWIDPVVGRYPVGRVGFQIQDAGATVDNVMIVDNTRDTTPPELNVKVAADKTKAGFSLTTNEYVVGELRYGIDGKFDKVAPLDRRPFVNTSVTIYVKSGTTYTYKVTVCDLQGNATTQKGYFTTPRDGPTRKAGQKSSGGF